jgi:SpoVK/Ycf46/Vps4 family AAA+-type ATPase
MNYLIVDLSRVFGGLVGETESNMRKLLEAIEAAAPCIVFVDELDSVLSAGRTSAGDSGTSGRVFNSFMTFMSDPSRSGKIVVLAASNRPDLLDAALIRAGRFDAKIAILPPARGDEKGRKAILKALVGKHSVKFSKDLVPTMEDKEEGLGRLLCDTNRLWTGAEIEVVTKKAISTAAFAYRTDEVGQKDYTITLEDWNHAMDVIVPNTREVEFQTKLALLFADDEDYVAAGWKSLFADKDQLRRDLGMLKGQEEE